MPRVLITGGTGGLGSELAPRFAAAGYTVRILSRRPRPERAEPAYEWAQAQLQSGEGLAEAVAGCDLLVHCASNAPSGKGDAEATRNLVSAAVAASGVPVFYISIVGVDKIRYAYYNAKLACERVLEESGNPYIILRAVQFHSLLDTFLTMLTRVPGLLLVPKSFRFQPMDTGEVAERMVAYATSGATGRLPDLGGPELLTAGEIAREWLRVRSSRRLMLNLPLMGKAAAGFRKGRNCVPDNPQGTITWRDWLQRKYKR